MPNVCMHVQTGKQMLTCFSSEEMAGWVTNTHFQCSELRVVLCLHLDILPELDPPFMRGPLSFFLPPLKQNPSLSSPAKKNFLQLFCTTKDCNVRQGNRTLVNIERRISLIVTY